MQWARFAPSPAPERDRPCGLPLRVFRPGSCDTSELEELSHAEALGVIPAGALGIAQDDPSVAAKVFVAGLGAALVGHSVKLEGGQELGESGLDGGG